MINNAGVIDTSLFQMTKLSKIKKNNHQESKTSTFKLKLPKHLSNLKAPANLYLPIKPSDINTTELYPLEITDLEKLIEVINLKTYFYTNNRCNKAVNGVSFDIEKGKT